MRKILIAFLLLGLVPKVWAQNDNSVGLPICQRPSICPPIPASQLDKTVTTQGNTFNGPLELVQLLGNGKLPALDGSNLFNVGGGSSATPGGLDTQVQFNQAGVFAGASDLRYDYTNNRVQIGPFATTAVAGLMIAHTSNQNALTISDNSNSTIYFRILNPLSSFGVSSAFIAADDYLILSGGGMTGGANISMKSNGNTGVGGVIVPLFTLDVGGQVNTNDRFSSAGTPIISGAFGEIQYNNGDTKILTSSPNLTFDGTTLTASALVVTGNINSINTVPYIWPVVQGAAGTSLTNDGAGNLTWTTSAAGGTDTQLLYNSGGVEVGSPNLVYDGTNLTFTTDGFWHDTSNTNTLAIAGGGISFTGNNLSGTEDTYTFNDTSADVLTMSAGNFHFVDGSGGTNFNINSDGIQVQVPPTSHFFTGTDVATYNFQMYNDGTEDIITDNGSSNPGLFVNFSSLIQLNAGGSLTIQANPILSAGIAGGSGGTITMLGATATGAATRHGSHILLVGGNGTAGAKLGHIQFAIQKSTAIVGEFNDKGELHVYKTLFATATGVNFSVDASSIVRSRAGGFMFPDGTVQVTAASGTTSGFTATSVWHKYTLSYTDFATAAYGNYATVAALPAGGVVQGVKIKPTESFAGGTISTYTISVGIVGNTEKYAEAFDVFQSTGGKVYQLSQDFDSENNDSAVNLIAQASSLGDTLDDASQGTVDIWLLISVAH